MGKWKYNSIHHIIRLIFHGDVTFKLYIVTALKFCNFWFVAGSSAPDTAMKLNQCFYKADSEVTVTKNTVIK